MKRIFKFVVIIFATLAFIFSSSKINTIEIAKADGKKVYSVPIELWHSENSGGGTLNPNGKRLARTGLESTSSVFAGIITLAGAVFLGRKRQK